MFLRKTCAAAAMAVAVAAAGAAFASAGDDRAARRPALLEDFDASHPAAAEVLKAADSTPGPGSDVTYAGLLNHAARAARRLKDNIGVDRGTTPSDRKRTARTPEAALELDLALEAYRQAADELDDAVDDAAGGPVHWLLAARAGLELARARPDRRQFAPLSGRTGLRIDDARKWTDLALPRLLQAGYALRETTVAALPADDPAAKAREASRVIAELGLKAQAAASAAFDRALQEEPLVAAYRRWMNEEADDAHPARPGRVTPFGDEKDAPAFEIADVPRLAPWPYSLAEALGIGTLELRWDAAGFESSKGDPNSGGVDALIGVNARLVLTEGAALPAYAIKLRSPSIDARTFGDDAGYREALKKYADGRYAAAAKALIADVTAVKTVPELWAKLANPAAAGGAAVDLKPFHDYHRRQLGENLAHNPMAYTLYLHFWGPNTTPTPRNSGSALEQDLYYLVRTPRWRINGPATPPPAAPLPATPPTPLPNDESWFRALSVQSRVAEPFDLDVTTVAGLIRDRLGRALTAAEDAAVAAVNQDPDLARLAEAEGRARGATARAIAAGLHGRHAQLTNAVLAAVPNYLPPEYLFTHPDPTGTAQAFAPSGPLPVVADLAKLRRDAEDAAERAVGRSETASPVWPEFCAALVDLESLGLKLYGRGFGSDPKEGDRLLAGKVRPEPATGFASSASGSLIEVGSELAGEDFRFLSRENARIVDRAAVVRLAILEVTWLDNFLPLVAANSPRWPAYAEAHRVVTTKTPLPTLPPPDLPFGVQPLLARRARLLAAVTAELEKLRGDAARTEEAAVKLQDLISQERIALFPEARLAPEARAFAVRFYDSVVFPIKQVSAAYESALQDARLLATGPLPEGRVAFYAGSWPLPVAVDGRTGRMLRALAADIRRLPQIKTWAETTNDDTLREAKLPPELLSEFRKTDHHNADLMLSRAADGFLATVMERALGYENLGLERREAWRAALTDFTSAGAPVDPGDWLTQAIHRHAAGAGWLLDVKDGPAGVEARGFHMADDNPGKP